MRRIIITNDAKSKADYDRVPEMFGENTTLCVSEISNFVYGKSGKEARQTSFLMAAYSAARMVLLSEYFYSYHHAMFIRKTNLKNLFYRKCIRFLLKKYGAKPIENYIRFLQVINFYKCMIISPLIRKNVKKILASFDEIIFTGIMQTEYEHTLYLACRKKKKRLVYHPYNWDNPTSKAAFPQLYFDVVYPWGMQMYESLSVILPNVSEVFKGPPRFYGLRVRPELDLEETNFVSFFGSQKDNPTILRKVLSSFLELGFNLKIRPHPHSVMKVSFFRSLENVILDKSVIPISADNEMRICDIDKGSIHSENLNQEWIWEKALFVITPASTSALEAALRGIPSVVDLTNGRQVTIAHARYLSHMSDFLTEDFVYNLYDLKQIKSRGFLSKINFNSSDIVKSASFFCSLDPLNQSI